MTFKLVVWAVALLFSALLYLHIRDSGRDAERQANTTRNMEAGNAGEAARARLNECSRLGLRYDYATGKCERDR